MILFGRVMFAIYTVIALGLIFRERLFKYILINKIKSDNDLDADSFAQDRWENEGGLPK